MWDPRGWAVREAVRRIRAMSSAVPPPKRFDCVKGCVTSAQTKQASNMTLRHGSSYWTSFEESRPSPGHHQVDIQASLSQPLSPKPLFCRASVALSFNFTGATADKDIIGFFLACNRDLVHHWRIKRCCCAFLWCLLSPRREKHRKPCHQNCSAIGNSPPSFSSRSFKELWNYLLFRSILAFPARVHRPQELPFRQMRNFSQLIVILRTVLPSRSNIHCHLLMTFDPEGSRTPAFSDWPHAERQQM